MKCGSDGSVRQDIFKPYFVWFQEYLPLKLSYYNAYLSQILKTIEY